MSDSDTASLDNLLKTRRGHRSVVTKLINNARAIAADFKDENRFRLMGLQSTLLEKRGLLETLDNQILTLTEDENDIENEIDRASEVKLTINECLFEIQATLKRADDPPSSILDTSTVSSTSRSLNSNGKLPNLSIKTFYGNPLEFQSFWDSFRAAIHENESLRDITKFNYLKTYLKGQAYSAISGITLTEENYSHAIEILEKRFGNKQILISSNIDQLLSLPQVPSITDVKKIRQVYDKIESTVRNLKSLKVDIKQYGPVLISIIMNKLPSEIRLHVSRIMPATEEWDVSYLLEVLLQEINSRELCSFMSQTNLRGENISRPRNRYHNDENGHQQQNNYTASALFSGFTDSSSQPTCTFCKQNHSSAKCMIVTDTASRKAILRTKAKCFVCLRSGHKASECKSKNKCFKCNSRHHISICDDRNSQAVKQTPTSLNQNEINPLSNSSNVNHQNDTQNKGINSINSDNSHSTMLSLNKEGNTLLQTARGIIINSENNTSKHVRILLDSGSQKSFINESLSKELRLPICRKEKKVLKPFEGQNEQLRQFDIVKATITNKYLENHVNTELIVVSNICSPISNQTIELAKNNYRHLINLPLADSNFNNETDLNIDILIGGDFYWDFVSGNIRRGESGPIALETSLGWILSGNVGVLSGLSNEHVSTHILKLGCLNSSVDYHSVRDRTLMNEVKRFWEIEDVHPISCKSHVDQGGKIVESFKSSIEFRDGHYTVGLPWKTDTLMLPDNFTPSKQRLISLLKRLKTKPDLFKKYDEIIKEQETNGIIETVDNSEFIKPGEVYYIPHREVVQQNRATTKVRVVYDASANKNGPSLNEMLETGPCLLPKIFEILLRARCHKFILVSDIQSAFLNIRVRERDRNFLRFLWINNIEKENPNIVIKRFTSVVFGLNCSPFLMSATIQNHMQKYVTLHKDIIPQFLADLYMDDSITGKSTEEEAFNFYLTCRILMKEGGFNLRKWMSNSKSLQEKIAEYESNYFGESNNFTDKDHKILGVQWALKSDELVFNISSLIDEYKDVTPVTKRVVLKFIASIFDPLGVLSPAVINFKLFFQKICGLTIDWDLPLSEELVTEWRNLFSDLIKLAPIYLPRYYLDKFSIEEIKSIEIHGFSDASAKAYASCVYLKFIFYDDTANVKFLCSKTRVNPLDKNLSIPRLELMGCFLLSNLLKSSLLSLKPIFANMNVYCWSDSTDCIYWINNTSKVWKQFIQNRVTKIRDNLPGIKWMHCPGSLNPADIPSRGKNIVKSELLELWLNGPNFIIYSEDKWPSQENITYHSTNIISEENVEKSAKSENLCDVLVIERFSSYEKAVRVLCYVKRFIYNCMMKMKKSEEKLLHGKIKFKEFKEAECSLLKDDQLVFKERKYEFIDLFNSLNIIEDGDGLLKVKGRLENSDLNFPILLNRESYLTKLIVWRSHIKRYHSGLKDTLNDVRQKYWVTRGRQTVKNVIKNCVVCLKQNSRPFKSVPAAPLPAYRVNIDFPFSSTGIDYLGPLYVKNIFKGDSNDLFKVYVALYTCASTRAVYLDLVPDASSRSFVNSLKRFIARHGSPKLFISDNARSFMGPEVQDFISYVNIDWNFILDLSPWWGGFWERLVQMVKRSMRKILQKNKLAYEELETVIIEIEGILNTRPLCYIYDDSVDTVITPSHLIYGRNLLTEIPSDHASNSDDNYEKRFKHLSTLIKRFWDRWSSEYLTELRERHKNCYKDPKRQIQNGEIVLIKEDKIPRSRWRMAKVEKLYFGRDNRVRGCQLKVISKSLLVNYVNRPIEKLCPLEIRAHQYENNSKTLFEEGIRPKREAAVRGILKRIESGQ